MINQRKILIAIPCMNEIDFIKDTISSIRNQSYKNFKLFICVNQPEKYHLFDEFKPIIESNLKTIQLANEIQDFEVHLIDKSTKGNGWDDKSYGVGWARKLLFDAVSKDAKIDDIVVSLDADTVFKENYFQSLIDNFNSFPLATALSVPYFHRLSGDNMLDSCMLRYEIYIRYYLINLFRISSPYAFTALGSAIAFPFGAYQKIRGLAPKFSGEDFYLLQKLRKSGRIIQWNSEAVYPATRYSDRVFFGTGPALIKGKTGDWSSYPIYDFQFFDQIHDVYSKLPALFYANQSTLIDEFIQSGFNSEPAVFWEDLRKNNPEIKRFIHAFHVKFDGLRILQFLRLFHFKQKLHNHSEEEILLNFLKKYFSDYIDNFNDFHNFSFAKSKVQVLDKIRNVLFKIEEDFRKEDLIFAKSNNNSIWKYLS